MTFIRAGKVNYRPQQCPSCMYYYASINRCIGYRQSGMNAMFGLASNDPCPKYSIADFEGIVKTVSEEYKNAVFSLGDLDAVYGGVPLFDVTSEVMRERLRSHIDGPPFKFSVRNGEVVEVE